MKHIAGTSFAVALLATGALSKSIPGNVQSFYNRVKNGKCNGGNNLKDGFYDRCFSGSGCDCDGSNCTSSTVLPSCHLLTYLFPQPSHTAKTTSPEQSTSTATMVV